MLGGASIAEEEARRFWGRGRICNDDDDAPGVVGDDGIGVVITGRANR